MVDRPDYAQRYSLIEALPPGRAVARHRALDAGGRSVIITVVRPDDPTLFLQGVDRAMAVRHSGLAAVVDAGRDGTDCYVVTEDAAGRDVEVTVGDGPLLPADAALIAVEAAGALAALHEGGAVHGAIDPAALVGERTGPMKLTGLGAGAALRPPDLRPGAPAEEARYLSPEEARGFEAGPAADVYRLGLVLYLMLTGTAAFDGADAATVARMQAEGVAPPPQMRNTAVPAALGEIVASALQKDPGQRPSAAALRQRLERLLAGASFVQPQAPPRRSRAPLWVTLAVVVVAAAIIAAWAAGVFGSGDQTAQVTVPDVVGMTSDGASNALEQAGLTVGTVSEVASTDGPEGTIVKQDPVAASKADKGAKVDLWVSTGAPSPTDVEVPDVIGRSQEEATQALSEAGFTVQVSQQASDTVPAGVVVEQRPTAGVTATPGSTVEIAVSSGPSASPSATTAQL